MPFYPNNLRYALDTRGLSILQAAKIGGISENRLAQALKTGRPPTAKQVEALTDGMALPTHAFFDPGFAIEEEEIVDFRTSNPHPLKAGANSKAFQKYKSFRDFFGVLSERLGVSTSTELIELDSEENAEQVAAAVRQQIRLGTARETSADKKSFLRQFRKAVESVGIFVVQDHNMSRDVDGLALYDERGRSHMIVINSSARNAGARSFTLSHELSHVLGKRSALSNNYQADNEIERFCNDFAASLLLPRNEFFDACEKNDLSFGNYPSAIDSATFLSSIFFTSISACLIRAFELGISQENHFPRFSRKLYSATHPDTESVKQFGGPKDGPPPGVVDRAYLGDRGTWLIATALHSKITSEIEIFTQTGLSRKRIRGIQQISDKEGLSFQ